MFTKTTLKFLTLTTGIAALTACGIPNDMEDFEDLFKTEPYEASFIDQDAAGEINGVTWELISGLAPKLAALQRHLISRSATLSRSI